MGNNYKIRPTLQINKRVIDPKDRGQIYEKMVGFLQWLSEKRIHLEKNLPAMQETQEMRV